MSVGAGGGRAIALMGVHGRCASSGVVDAATLAGGLALVDVLATVGEARVGVALVLSAGVGVGDGARPVMVVSL